MTKQLTPYIAIAFAIILGGCRSDYDGPDAAGLRGEPLELSITSAEAIIPGTNSTRYSETDYGRVTVFEKGDVVGLSVLGTNAKGEDVLLANNVPYKYDGEKWDVDTDSVPESRRVYFEKSMHTYIVYYPYKREGENCKTIQDIKDKCFPHQVNQTTREAYILSDPMAGSVSGKGIRNLKVTLSHLRNSVMLDPKVRWKLTNDSIITYQPLREALEAFAIRDFRGDSLQVYHAPDSTYRYILPDYYDGEITWRYAYRYYKFTGKCNVNGGRVGVRYVQDELVDMGVYDTSKALELDCFCKDANDNGYILPWDAVALLRKDKRRCIGVVHHLGQNARDSVSYSKTPVGSEKCRGYVLALTDTHQDESGLEWDYLVSITYKEYAGTNRRGGNDQLNRDWNGLDNCESIKAYAEKKGLKLPYFPAEYSCFTYGSNWQKGLEAPVNTTEWFLPSDGILHHYLSYDLEKLRATDLDAIINKRFEYIKMHTDDQLPYHQYIRPLSWVKSYHSSTEMVGALIGRLVFGLNLSNRTVGAEIVYKNLNSLVRPVLVF